MYRAGGSGIVLLCAVVGCAAVDNAPQADPAGKLSEMVFRCKVEPILARQCSYNACHGNAGAALRVYTPGKLRATQPMTIDDAIAPLTDAEQHANFESASGFSFDTPVDDNWLLRKPLPATSGGFAHKGGAIYIDANDSQYVAIRAWLSGSGACM
jgi:hypothetical protein